MRVLPCRDVIPYGNVSMAGSAAACPVIEGGRLVPGNTPA